MHALIYTTRFTSRAQNLTTAAPRYHDIPLKHQDCLGGHTAPKCHHDLEINLGHRQRRCFPTSFTFGEACEGSLSPAVPGHWSWRHSPTSLAFRACPPHTALPASHPLLRARLWGRAWSQPVHLYLVAVPTPQHGGRSQGWQRLENTLVTQLIQSWLPVPHQGPSNPGAGQLGPWAKPHLPPVFVNEVLADHSHTRRLT